MGEPRVTDEMINAAAAHLAVDDDWFTPSRDKIRCAIKAALAAIPDPQPEPATDVRKVKAEAWREAADLCERSFGAETHLARTLGRGFGEWLRARAADLERGSGDDA